MPTDPHDPSRPPAPDPPTPRGADPGPGPLPPELGPPELLALGQPSPRLWSQLHGAGPVIVAGTDDPLEPRPGGRLRQGPSADRLLRATLADVLWLDAPTSAERGSERPPTPVRHASNPRRIWMLEQSDREPLAFAHAVLETARQRAFSSASQAVGILDTAWALFGETRLDAIDRRRARDLKILALAYRADELRLAGGHLEAELHLRKARRRTERDTDVEVRARLLEIEADLASTIGEIGRALRLLDEAEPLLEGCPIPGRRVTLDLRRARVDLARRRPDKALPSLLRATEALPADRSFRLRLEIGHSLAMTFLSLRRHGEATEALDAIDHLYGGLYADPRLCSQKWWMEGHLALAADTPEDLEEAMVRFRQSLDVFLEHGQTRDAFRAFADWTVAAGKLDLLVEQRRDMQRTFARLLDMPGVLDLGRFELQRWLDRASALGLEAPSLKRLLERLESSTGWRH